MDEAEAVRWSLEQKIVTLTPTVGLGSVVEAVAGEVIRGGWWGHPSAKEIYAVSEALGAHPHIRVTRLIEGRITFVCQDLVPAFLAIVTDPGFRQAARVGLAGPSAALLAVVEEHGAVSTHAARRYLGVGAKALSRARTPLIRRLLVDTTQVHTSVGHHEMLLSVFAAGEVPLPSYGAAVAALRGVLGEALRLPERQP